MANPYEPPIEMASPNTSNRIDCVTAKSRFRKLLLVSVIVSLVGISISFATESSLPAPLIAYLDTQTLKTNSTLELVIFAVFVLIVVLSIWNIVQLYNFKPNSRAILIALLIAESVVGLFVGPIVESPVSGMFSDASMLLWGVVIAMMYCTPYADCFSSPTPQRGG